MESNLNLIFRFTCICPKLISDRGVRFAQTEFDNMIEFERSYGNMFKDVDRVG